MASDAERDVMGLLLTTNAELVSSVLRGVSGSQQPDVLAAVAATRSLDLIVDDILHALVRQARAEGRTWAEIGDVLRVTRQAAFQRFGSQGTGAPALEGSIQPLPGAPEKAVAVLEHWAGNRWEDVRLDFDERMTEALSVGMLESARTEIERRFGPLLEIGTPSATIRSAYTVVDVPMAFEQGDLKGRVAFNVDGRVAGFFVVPADAA